MVESGPSRNSAYTRPLVEFVHYPARPRSSRAGTLSTAPLKYIAAVLLFALSAIPSLAQRFEARLFGQEDGLDNLAISAIAQDPQGFLWVASQNGLFRYDGARFEAYGAPSGLTDPSVLTLLVDRHGILWAGSHTGLFWFDGNAFHELKYNETGLHVGTNSMIAATAAGEVIVATAKELFSIEQAPSVSKQSQSWSVTPYRLRHPSFPQPEDMNGIGVDAADRFWVGCGEAICGFREPVLQTFGKEQGVPPDFYMSFFLARDGRMYARGRKNIVTWKQGDNSVTDLTSLFPPNATKTIHRRFTEDVFGHVITPTASGFATWDGVRWTETVRTSRAEIDGASDVFFDREGDLWIGTEGSGLLESLGYGLWKNYGGTEGLGNPHVFAIATDKSGTLWAGHDRGLNRLERGASVFAPSALASDQDASQIQSLAPSPDGGVWAGGLLGHIFHLNAMGKADIHVAIDTYIRRLRVDSAGTLWAGTSTGLYTLNCPSGRPCFPKSVAGLEKAVVHDFAIDPKGVIWATEEKSIDRIEPSTASARK